MDVETIARAEGARRVKLTGAELDLLFKEGRCFECCELGHMARECQENLAEAKK